MVTSFERMTEEYVWCYYLWLTTGSAKRKCKQSSQYNNPWLLFLQQPWHHVISYHKLKNAFPFISESNMQEKAEKNFKAVSRTSLSAHFKLYWYDMKKSQKQWKLINFKNQLLEKLCWWRLSLEWNQSGSLEINPLRRLQQLKIKGI